MIHVTTATDPHTGTSVILLHTEHDVATLDQETAALLAVLLSYLGTGREVDQLRRALHTAATVAGEADPIRTALEINRHLAALERAEHEQQRAGTHPHPRH